MTDLTALTRDFLRDDGGSPLGPGMPTGSPLRADGQSHYDAWRPHAGRRSADSVHPR